MNNDYDYAQASLSIMLGTTERLSYLEVVGQYSAVIQSGDYLDNVCSSLEMTAIIIEAIEIGQIIERLVGGTISSHDMFLLRTWHEYLVTRGYRKRYMEE